MRKVFILMLAFWVTPLFAQSERLGQVAVASAHPLATQAGLDVLAQGGNAFDAAIAVSAALAVVEPYSSGLGGGGFWLLHFADTKLKERNVLIDGREVAPLKASKDMYLSDSGRQSRLSSREGALAAAIPGEPAALSYMAQEYGQLPLSKTLQPAILLAEEGFEVGDAYIKALLYRNRALLQFPSTKAVLLDQGQLPKPGFKLVQKDLAKILRVLAEQGHEGFYEGSVAKSLVEGVQKQGGIWTLEDLKNYEVKVRKPLVAQYKDLKIITAPPPSAGGLAVLTALKIIEQYEEDPLSKSDQVHLVAESLRRAYCDRIKYLGDPDFTHVPIGHLLSDAHIDSLRSTLDLSKATSSNALKCGLPSQEEGQQTTHFSIMDGEGNRVAATLSINQYFGSGFIVPGTGILLNNEMDDFSTVLGEGNLYGLVGHYSNVIAPEKRPLSSMTPTFIESKKGIAMLGTPGGSRIPSMVLLSILEFEQEASPLTWVATPRYHHQYLPDVISYEPGAFSSSVKNALKLRGHKLEPVGHTYGDMQLVFWDQAARRMVAVSDPRGYGSAKVVRSKKDQE